MSGSGDAPAPLYQPTADDGAYQLRFSWTGWPSEKLFADQPIHLIEQTKRLWERDNMRVLESRWTPELVQILFSAKPTVSPVFIAHRAKGRLDNALQRAGIRAPFSRKVAVRAVGDKTRRDVEAYIERQVAKDCYVDQRFARWLSELTVRNATVDLSQPAESARGRYWHNLHLVLVVDQHYNIRTLDVLTGLRDCFLKISAAKKHRVSCLSILPSHLHAAIRPPIETTPLEVVHTYQNNLAALLRLGRLWSTGYYVGTFGEYSMQAVRNVVGKSG